MGGKLYDHLLDNGVLKLKSPSKDRDLSANFFYLSCFTRGEVENAAGDYATKNPLGQGKSSLESGR